MSRISPSNPSHQNPLNFPIILRNDIPEIGLGFDDPTILEAFQENWATLMD